jgi:hypothetical protein
LEKFGVDHPSQNKDIKENLLEIIHFKKLYPDNVILIWGNHDVEYYINEPWKPLKYHCSGFRPEMHFDLYDIFSQNKDIFQLAYQYNNYLFSHSGVHYGWYHFVFTKAIKDMDMQDLNITEQLNEAFKYKLDCLFDVDWYRGGTKKVGGPFWCGKELIIKKTLKNTHQIIGHTHHQDFKTYKIGKDASVTFCDVLDSKNEPYILEI